MERLLKVIALSLTIVFALAACSKGNQSSQGGASPSESASAMESASPAESAPAGAAAASPSGSSVAANGAMASSGGKVYSTNCSSCHQPNGQGVSGTFPPLAGNPVVTGDPTKVIRIVKYGLNGQIQVKGQTYNGMMPAWGQQLSNSDIAAVITYVRSSWGNSASAVTTSQVSAVSQ
jgi:mono/diheme cytochrome c family protein